MNKYDMICLKGFKCDDWFGNVAARALIATMKPNISDGARKTLARLALYILGETERIHQFDGEYFAEAMEKLHAVIVPNNVNPIGYAVKEFARMTNELIIGNNSLDVLSKIARETLERFVRTEPA